MSNAIDLQMLEQVLREKELRELTPHQWRDRMIDFRECTKPFVNAKIMIASRYAPRIIIGHGKIEVFQPQYTQSDTDLLAMLDEAIDHCAHSLGLRP